MRFRYCISLVLIIIPILWSSFSTHGHDDLVNFYAGTRQEMTDTAYVNESDFHLRITFGQNCTRFSVEVPDLPVFLNNLSGVYIDRKWIAGSSNSDTLFLNPDAPPGRCTVPIKISYITENDTYIQYYNNLTLNYKKSFEITSLQLPTRDNMIFSIELDTFIKFDDIKIVFFPGGLSINPEEIQIFNMDKGSYIFSANVTECASPDPNDEMNFYIQAFIDNRKISIVEMEIPIDLNGDGHNNNNQNNDGDTSEPIFKIKEETRYLLILVIIITIILFNVFYHKKIKLKR